MTSTLPPFYIVDLDKNTPLSLLHFFESPIIPLHYGFTGTPVGPTDNAGFLIERGTESDVQLIWDESNDFFKMGIVNSEIRIAGIENLPDNYAIPYWLNNKLETDSQLLTLSLSGSVGIGTNNPSAKLHIVQTGTSGVDAFRVDDKASDTTFFRITEEGQVVFMQQDPASYQTVLRVINTTNTYDAIRFGVSAIGVGDISCLDGSGIRGVQITGNSTAGPNFFLGNVGIGTNNPTSKLYVRDNTNECISVIQSTAINKNAIQRIHASYDSVKSACGDAIIQLGNKSIITGELVTPDNAWYIGTHANGGTTDFDPPLKIGFKGSVWGVPGDNDLVTIRSDGRFGIGNINPTNKLQVTGTTLLNGDISTTPLYEYPPSGLTANTSTLSGLIYGNGTYIASSSSIVGIYDAFKAFDKSSGSTSYWSSGGLYDTTTGAYLGTASTSSLGYTGEWLQIQLPLTIKLQTFSIQAVSIYGTSRAPKNFRIFGSNDGTTFSSMSDEFIDDFIVGQTKTYTVSSDVEYTTFRLVINKRDPLTTDTGAVQISEFKLYGIQTSSTTLCTIGENVGIGTISPNSKLQIGSLNVRSITAENINNVGGWAYNSNILGFNMSTNTSTGSMTCYSDGSNIKSAFIANQNGQLQFGNYAATSTSDYTGIFSGTGGIGTTLTKMVISPNGNVAIGTTNPTSNCILDINSTSQVVKIPLLSYSTKTGLSTEGSICYDSTLKSLSYNNGGAITNWKGTRKAMNMIYNRAAYSSLTLSSSTNTGITISLSSSLSKIGDNDFDIVTVSSNTYYGIKYSNTTTPPVSTLFKLTFNFTFSVNSAITIRFGIMKNATSTTTFVEGSQRVLSCAVSTNYTINITILVSSVNSGDYFILGASSSSGTLTLGAGGTTYNDVIVIAETVL